MWIFHFPDFIDLSLVSVWLCNHLILAEFLPLIPLTSSTFWKTYLNDYKARLPSNSALAERHEALEARSEVTPLETSLAVGGYRQCQHQLIKVSWSVTLVFCLLRSHGCSFVYLVIHFYRPVKNTSYNAKHWFSTNEKKKENVTHCLQKLPSGKSQLSMIDSGEELATIKHI